MEDPQFEVYSYNIIGEHGWLLRVFVWIAEQALCHGDGQVGGVKS